MGDLSKNLSRWEMACKCGCGFDTVDIDLVYALQNAVTYFEHKYNEQVILRITGGNRCEYKNKAETGADSSHHMYARAADHQFFLVDSKRQISANEVSAYYMKTYTGKWGIGRYPNRTHLDTRTNGPARWSRNK